jgi:hypothetical protein
VGPGLTAGRATAWAAYAAFALALLSAVPSLYWALGVAAWHHGRARDLLALGRLAKLVE